MPAISHGSPHPHPPLPPGRVYGGVSRGYPTFVFDWTFGRTPETGATGYKIRRRDGYYTFRNFHYDIMRYDVYSHKHDRLELRFRKPRAKRNVYVSVL